MHWKKLDKKTKWGIVGGVVLLCVLGTVVAFSLRHDPGKENNPAPSQSPTAAQGTDPVQEGEKEPVASDGGSVGQDTPDQGQGQGGQGSGQQGNSQSISFPYVISGTGLTVRKLDSYDGVYIEDGSDVQVSNLCVILLENTMDTVAEYAKVTVVLDGKTLTFEASAIPPKSTVVVQESGKSSWVDGKCTSCTAEVARLDEFELSEDQVKVVDNGDGSLTVTNLTDQEIPAVRLFYKFYMEEEDVYVGGIAYTAKITGLKGDSSVTVTPSHYVSGSAKVLMVRTYDEA